jgi:hypothetical protein
MCPVAADGGGPAVNTSPHTRCHKGKRVLIYLRDGQRFEDYFEGYTSREIILRVRGKVRKADLRSLVIARGVVF